MGEDLKIVCGRSHPELGAAIARNLGIEVTPSEVVRFSNENLLVQIRENVRASDVFVVQTSTSPVNEYIMETLIFIDALKRASAGRVTAVIPYFPYVRSDKKDRPRISITARLMADLLEAAGADRVITMDLHSPQIQGFFKIPVDQLAAQPIIEAHLRSTIDLSTAVIVATDAGGAKDAGKFAAKLGLDFAIIDKRRFGDDERATAGSLIGDVDGRTAILLDDEIASGGTMVEAIEFLRRKGASRVVAGASHAVFTGRAPELLQASRVEQVIVTDTVPIPVQKQFEKLHTLSVAQLFADAIGRVHDGRSVSQLF